MQCANSALTRSLSTRYTSCEQRAIRADLHRLVIVTDPTLVYVTDMWWLNVER
jgi:hypothetical protein